MTIQEPKKIFELPPTCHFMFDIDLAEQKSHIFPVSIAIQHFRVKVSGGVALPPPIICISIVLLLRM